MSRDQSLLRELEGADGSTSLRLYGAKASQRYLIYPKARSPGYDHARTVLARSIRSKANECDKGDATMRERTRVADLTYEGRFYM